MRYRRQIKDRHGVWNTSPPRFDEAMIQVVQRRIRASSLQNVRYVDTQTGEIMDIAWDEWTEDADAI